MLAVVQSSFMSYGSTAPSHYVTFKGTGRLAIYIYRTNIHAVLYISKAVYLMSEVSSTAHG